MKNHQYLLLLMLYCSLFSCTPDFQQERKERETKDSLRIADSIAEVKKKVAEELQDSAYFKKANAIFKRYGYLPTIEMRIGNEVIPAQTEHWMNSDDFNEVKIYYKVTPNGFDNEMNPTDEVYVLNKSLYTLTSIKFLYLPRSFRPGRTQHIEKYFLERSYNITVYSQNDVPGYNATSDIKLPEIPDYYLWIIAKVRLENGALQYAIIRDWPGL